MLILTFLLTAMIEGTSANDISNLMLAIEDENIDEVKQLLNTVDVASKDEFGRNVLHAAAYSNGEITRLLISRGADRVVNDHAPDSIVSPLLHACFVMNQYEYLPHMYEIIEAILKAGGDPNVSNLDLITPLHLIRTGPEARLLISYGANGNAKAKYGNTPALFNMQYIRIDYDVFYALADGNADFAITNNLGETIFHMITAMNASLWTKDFLAFVTRNGVPLDALNERGETALTKFLKRDIRLSFWQLEGQRILYDSLKDSFYARMAEVGANLSAPNKYGETLLHIAVLKYHVGMAKWLLENGADAEAKNADGNSPLMALIKQEKPNCEKSLLSVKKRNEIMAMMDVLLEGGARVDIMDESGHKFSLLLADIEDDSVWTNISNVV